MVQTDTLVDSRLCAGSDGASAPFLLMQCLDPISGSAHWFVALQPRLHLAVTLPLFFAAPREVPFFLIPVTHFTSTYACASRQLAFFDLRFSSRLAWPPRSRCGLLLRERARSLLRSPFDVASCTNAFQILRHSEWAYSCFPVCCIPFIVMRWLMLELRFSRWPCATMRGSAFCRLR